MEMVWVSGQLSLVCVGDVRTPSIFSIKSQKVDKDIKGMT